MIKEFKELRHWCNKHDNAHKNTLKNNKHGWFMDKLVSANSDYNEEWVEDSITHCPYCGEHLEAPKKKYFLFQSYTDTDLCLAGNSDPVFTAIKEAEFFYSNIKETIKTLISEKPKGLAVNVTVSLQEQ